MPRPPPMRGGNSNFTSPLILPDNPPMSLPKPFGFLLLLLLAMPPLNGADRPNIIYLMTDDQRADALGCMGNQIIQTPHIDGLAEQGVMYGVPASRSTTET